jgi:hypothetical protein
MESIDIEEPKNSEKQSLLIKTNNDEEKFFK